MEGMEAITTALTTAIGGLATNIMSLIGGVIPSLMPIFAALLGITVILRLARSVAS